MPRPLALAAWQSRGTDVVLAQEPMPVQWLKVHLPRANTAFMHYLHNVMYLHAKRHKTKV